MPKPATSKEHIKQLELLYHRLGDHGWQLSLKAPDKTNPFHTIVADVLSEDNDEQILWNIELSFVPIPADNLPDVSILQCFIPLANTFTQLIKPNIYEITARLNTKLPLVGFGFLEDHNLLYFKHNMMVANENTDTTALIVSESMSMITYLVSTFTNPIIEVATGGKTADEMIAQLQRQKLFS